MGTYKIGIYNPQNILQGTISDGTYAIKYSSLENQATSSVSSSSPYIKISNSGAVSPDTAMLGSSQNNWGCTKDKKTGLIWEIKTTDDGLRDTIKVYTYPQAKKFVDNVNTQMLCGYSNWRIPTYRELYTLVGSSKTIDPTYFPNTQNDWYWTSDGSGTTVINFKSGDSNFFNHPDYYFGLRLVHD